MNCKLIILVLASMMFNVSAADLCWSENNMDTLSREETQTRRLQAITQNKMYDEPQFGALFGELEHAHHESAFTSTWPATEEALGAVPITLESNVSRFALLSKIGNVGSTTLEVLGPVGDAIAVGFWVDNLVETFTNESAGSLDKVAATFSILPLVGDELNLLSNDIKYFAAKDKVQEIEHQMHYVFGDKGAAFNRIRNKKTDAINLIHQYDNHVKMVSSMYIDHLLIQSDTEYRRAAAGYDRQLSRQMARMDLEFLKTFGYLSVERDLNMPMCEIESIQVGGLLECIKKSGSVRILDLIAKLKNPEINRLKSQIFQAKVTLVQSADIALQRYRVELIESIKRRAQKHVLEIINHSKLNRSYLEFQARKSGLREYAKAYWDIDYLTEEQLNTATVMVRPARTCWGIPSVYPGGIQASIEACRDSGPVYDSYHVSKDSELVNVIDKKVTFNVGKYIDTRIYSGWRENLLRYQVRNVAFAYIQGTIANNIFNSQISRLEQIQTLPYQTTYSEYLEGLGLDSLNSALRMDWKHISRWYELIVTESPTGNIISNITQINVFRSLIQPQFELALTLASLRDRFYSIPFPSAYSPADLRFYSPRMADIFDTIIATSSVKLPRPVEINGMIDDAVEQVLVATSQVSSANELQSLLGDLTLYVEIAQHQRSEPAPANLTIHGIQSQQQLFNTALSPFYYGYLNPENQALKNAALETTTAHPVWGDLEAIIPVLRSGDINTAIAMLGTSISRLNPSTASFIHATLLLELEQWVEINLALEAGNEQ